MNFQASGSEGKRSKRSKKGSAATNGDTSNGGGDGHGDNEYPAEVVPKTSKEVSFIILIEEYICFLMV